MKLLHAESGEILEEPPVVAFETHNGQHKILAIGREALVYKDRSDVTLANGFDHPRTLIADFIMAETALKHFMSRLPKPKAMRLRLPPVLVLHPLEKQEGGYTPIEMRAFRELGIGAGAWRVYIWTGRPLTREEIRDRRFPAHESHRLYSE